MTVTLTVAEEVPLVNPAKRSLVDKDLMSKGENLPNEDAQRVGFLDIFKAIKNLPPGMPSVLLVTALTWVCEFYDHN